MSTSEKGHYVRFDETLVGALDFCDTGILRRALSNFDHLADQYAQPRIKWVALGGTNGEAPQADDPTTLGIGVFHRVWTSGPFDLHVRSNGESYRCRLRARVHHEAAPAAQYVTFRFVLCPVGMGAQLRDLGGSNVLDVLSSSGESAQWKYAGMIHLDANLTAAAQQGVSTINQIGGAGVSGRWVRAQLVAFGSSSDADLAFPLLSGVDLCEYLTP